MWVLEQELESELQVQVVQVEQQVEQVVEVVEVQEVQVVEVQVEQVPHRRATSEQVQGCPRARCPRTRCPRPRESLARSKSRMV